MRLINSNLLIPCSLSKLIISILLVLLMIQPFLMKCANARVGRKNKRVQSCLSLCYKTTCLAKTHRRDLIYRMQKSKPQYWRLPEGSIYFYGLHTFLCMWLITTRKRIGKRYTKCNVEAVKRFHDFNNYSILDVITQQWKSLHQIALISWYFVLIVYNFLS